MVMRTVVFDLDGTLADTSGDLIAAANACFRLLGHGDVLNATTDSSTALLGGRPMLRLGFQRLGVEWDEAMVDRQYPVLLEAYDAAIDVYTTLYPGAAEAVQLLGAAGFTTAICTNKPEALAEKLTRSLGIRDLFGALVGADTTPRRKPDTVPYKEAVLRSGGRPYRSMMVGDTETDRLTAEGANVPCVLVTFGPEGAGVARYEPTALLDHFDDLHDLALRLLPG